MRPSTSPRLCVLRRTARGGEHGGARSPGGGGGWRQAGAQRGAAAGSELTEEQGPSGMRLGQAGKCAVRCGAVRTVQAWPGREGTAEGLAVSRRFQRDNQPYLGSPQAFPGTQCLRRPGGARHSGCLGAESPSAPDLLQHVSRAPLAARALPDHAHGDARRGRARRSPGGGGGGGGGGSGSWRLRAAPAPCPRRSRPGEWHRVSPATPLGRPSRAPLQPLCAPRETSGFSPPPGMQSRGD